MRLDPHTSVENQEKLGGNLTLADDLYVGRPADLATVPGQDLQLRRAKAGEKL